MAWPKWIDKLLSVIPVVGDIVGSNQQAQTAERNTDATNAANMELARYGRQEDLNQWNRQNALNQRLWQQQNEYNEAQRDNQRAYEMSLWNMQNEYNSPAAQMQRFKDAGLNPNMIYGQGSPGNAGSIGSGSQVSSAGFQANQLPRYQAPRLEFNYKPSVDIPSAISAYQDFQMRQAQTDNLRAQEEYTRSRTVNEALRSNLIDVDTRSKEFSLENILPHQADKTKYDSRVSEAKIQTEYQKLLLMTQQEKMNRLDTMYKRSNLDMQQVELEKKQAEVLFQKYKNQWMAEGITTSDDVMLRILVRMLNEAGISPSELIGN